MRDSVKEIISPTDLTNGKRNPSEDKGPPVKVLVLFGTRPEVIKLAPVIHRLKKNNSFRTIVVSSSQHTDLLLPFLGIFKIAVDHDLQVMTADQNPNQVLSRVLDRLDALLNLEKPDVILVQGDTTTALAGAIAGFQRKIKVGHVEAGLRSGNLRSPFPEEANRRLISQIADLHFAATSRNRDALLSEKIPVTQIYQTGNPVVDALHFIMRKSKPSKEVNRLIGKTRSFKRILLTTHRRESFGERMRRNLTRLREFIEKHPDTCLLFPVHPNPNVKRMTNEILSDHERIHLLEPLDYTDFVALMSESWLIVSDSGGVQEEAPSLGKPVLILRENTERAEAIEMGVAKLVGKRAAHLFQLLEENYYIKTWINSVKQVNNPFGDGKASKRIVKILEEEFKAKIGDAARSKVAKA